MAAISRSQWLEWLQWIAIRGAIGPVRQDYYSNVGLHAARQQVGGGEIALSDLLPWVKADTDEDDE